jgi:hypothetical protein
LYCPSNNFRTGLLVVPSGLYHYQDETIGIGTGQVNVHDFAGCLPDVLVQILLCGVNDDEGRTQDVVRAVTFPDLRSVGGSHIRVYHAGGPKPRAEHHQDAFSLTFWISRVLPTFVSLTVVILVDPPFLLSHDYNSYNSDSDHDNHDAKDDEEYDGTWI